MALRVDDAVSRTSKFLLEVGIKPGETTSTHAHAAMAVYALSAGSRRGLLEAIETAGAVSLV